MKTIIPAIFIFIFMCVSGMSQNPQFTGKYLYQSLASRVFAVSSGDINNDGKTDIVFTEPDNNLLQWLKNEGNDQFTLKQAGAFQAIGIKTLDFNADGHTDILACSYNLNQVVLFENDGNENFTMHVLSNAATHPLVISAGDINGDGDIDIAVATQDAGTGVVLLVNNGNYNFTFMQLDANAYSSTWTEMVDLDRDGDMDVVGADFTATGGLVWYEQTTPLVFTRHFISYPSTHGGAVGDIDGDGDLDLAAAACGSGIAWFENDGSNNFIPHPVFGSYNCAVSIGISDFDNDSVNDIAAVAYGSNRVDWWKNDGSQVFTRNKVCDSLVHPSDLCIADINGDGYSDILTGSYAKKLAYFRNTGHMTGDIRIKKKEAFLLGNDFSSKCVTVYWDNTGEGKRTLELYDLNGAMLSSVEVAANAGTTTISIPSAGLFILKIHMDTGDYFRKIVQP
ncbi:MAG: FG-GAP-like repeat-containing protein [Bacteroidota bacterium]